MTASLILSDNDRQLELISLPPGIYLADEPPFVAPLTVSENSFATSIDMEGARRVRSKPLNPEGRGAVHIDEETSLDFWDSVDNFLDLVASAHRNKGTLTWTAPEGQAITFELEAIQATSFPQNRMLRQRSGTVEFEFVCAPYGLLPEEVLSLGVDDSGPVPGGGFVGPIDGADIELQGGTELARGVLFLTDVDNQHRDDVTVAIQENYDPDNPEPLRLGADELDVTDFAGIFDTDHVEVSVPPDWVAVCGTGALPHQGMWRVFARCMCASLDTQVRLSYRSGDGPLSQTERAVVTPHVTGDGIELDLGLVNIRDLMGDDAWSGQVEVRAATIGDFEITDLLFVPGTGYARARGSLAHNVSAGGLVAADNFDAHSAGVMAGKTAQLGGDWAGAGDTDDFEADGAGAMTRSAGSDTNLNTGQYLRLGTGVATQTEARIDILLNTSSDAVAGIQRRGVFIRYVDTSNWLMAVYEGIASETVNWRVVLYKRVAGTVTELDSNVVNVGGAAVWRTMLVTADEDGNAALVEGPRGDSLTWLAGVDEDTDLATAGALDDGGYGAYDARTAATEIVRWYDNFAVTAPSGIAAPIHALYADQSLLFDYRSAQHNPAGTRWGRVPHFEGARLFIPPSTRNSYVHRLVVKQDRNDLTQFAVGDQNDELTANLTVTPRVALTSG